MNQGSQISKLRTALVAAAVASALAACASAPARPEGAAQARARLTQLQSDPALANRAPLAIEAADRAVQLAEEPDSDNQLAAYRVYMADRKIDIARAEAETRLAEDQRPALVEQSEKARLDARTREAEAAQTQADTARIEGAEQKLDADTARSEANDANSAAASSQQQASDALGEVSAANLAAVSSRQQQSLELQRQIDVLQARVTDRGLVVTLGDDLFARGGSALKDGSSGGLNKLVVFLDEYPARTAVIEAYSDNAGDSEDNQSLSQRRADAVMSYLVQQGISSDRLTASGKGAGIPIADNDSPTGQQQNRRVEVIIDSPGEALR